MQEQSTISDDDEQKRPASALKLLDELSDSLRLPIMEMSDEELEVLDDLSHLKDVLRSIERVRSGEAKSDAFKIYQGRMIIDFEVYASNPKARPEEWKWIAE